MAKNVVQVVDAIQAKGGVRIARAAVTSRMHQMIVQDQFIHTSLFHPHI
jgi:hypothetical protein